MTPVRSTMRSSFFTNPDVPCPTSWPCSFRKPWAGNPDMDEEKRAFYEYHASLMEPWDGPAAIAFTDGKVIGATLDRNGTASGPLHRDQG